jgi:hypothetical protein
MLQQGSIALCIDLPDAVLAQCVAAGDQDAFPLLMRRCNQTLYQGPPAAFSWAKQGPKTSSKTLICSPSA